MAKLNNKEGKVSLILLINKNEKINRFIAEWRNLNELKNNKKFAKYVKRNSASV